MTSRARSPAGRGRPVRTAGPPRLQPLADADLEAVHALNERAVPAVNSVPPQALLTLRRQAECVLTAHLGGELAGFLELLGPNADYDSPNYLWFRTRYPQFLYVDRVVVAAAARRQGIARLFYREAWSRASRRAAPLACEVNLEPPNPQSMALHRELGFREVGRQSTEGGAKTVCLMIKDRP